MKLLRVAALSLAVFCIGTRAADASHAVDGMLAITAPAPIESGRPANAPTTGNAPGIGLQETSQCPVGIIAIFPRETKTVDGRDYGAILYSPLGPGVSTGTFWINASGLAYHVAFSNRKVLSKTLSGDVDVIHFQLPIEAHLENAFVDGLEGGDASISGGCHILDAWFSRLNEFLPAAAISRFRNAIRHLASAPIDAQPIADPKTQCLAPSLGPTTLLAVPPTSPFRPREKRVVNVLVSLAADSSILTAEPLVQSDRAFDDASVAAAKASLFRTEVRNCRPIAAKYIFSVEYRL